MILILDWFIDVFVLNVGGMGGKYLIGVMLYEVMNIFVVNVLGYVVFVDEFLYY